MIRQFLNWWFGQLAQLLPFSSSADEGQWLDITVDADRVRAALSDNRERLLMDVERVQSSSSQLPLPLHGELERIANALDQTRVRCRLWVAADTVLTREIELPLAAEENLREVLSFEMARKTPFRAQDVHFDASITARDPVRKMLTVKLDVVPRRSLEDITSVLSDWSLEATTSAAAARVAQRSAQAVFAFQGALFTRRSFTALNSVLAFIVVALAAACVWLPINSQQQIREQLRTQVDNARAQATEAMALRDEFDAVQRASRILSDARAARPTMVQVLEELTRALPDNTWLSRLQIDGGEVNLHGSSRTASELIGILEQLALLEGVRFASPVTRDAANGGERFHIVARLNAPASDDAVFADEQS